MRREVVVVNIVWFLAYARGRKAGFSVRMDNVCSACLPPPSRLDHDPSKITVVSFCANC